MQLELVQPGKHLINAEEVVIRDFKAHFLSVLAGTAQFFLPLLWDRLLTQTKITINLFFQSNETPNVSAYAHLRVPFDYNKTPLAPIETKFIIYRKQRQCGFWEPHRSKRFYIGPA